MEKRSISIPEMGKLLGLKKGAACYLVRQGRFNTTQIGRQTRIYLDSFEEWYANQLHYKKITGEAPGAKLKESTWSVREVATMLGICEATLYEKMKRHPFKTTIVDFHTRIDKADFQRWFEKQTLYTKLYPLQGREEI